MPEVVYEGPVWVDFNRIQDQRRASRQAHYAGALPLDLLNEEHDRLAHQLDLVTARLGALDNACRSIPTPSNKP